MPSSVEIDQDALERETFDLEQDIESDIVMESKGQA